MTTLVSTDAHGVRVVMQIIPLEGSEPVQSPSVVKHCIVEPEVPYMTRIFLKGEPVALGTVQVFVALVMMFFGAIAWVTKTLDGEVPLGLGLSFLLCGSVTLSAHKGTRPALIKSTLALNIIGVVMAISGISFFSYLLAVPARLDVCTDNENYWSDCRSMYWALKTMVLSMKAVLLIFSVLEACVCTTLIVYASKAFAPENNGSVNGDDQLQGSTETLLKNEKELGLPPAYTV